MSGEERRSADGAASDSSEVPSATHNTTTTTSSVPSKLRHGRKPMYDSDASADGLDPAVDDEELERGGAPAEAQAHEADPLLRTSNSRRQSGGLFANVSQRWSDFFHSQTGGRGSVRRGKRRDLGSATSARRVSSGSNSPSSFAVFRANHPALLRALWVLLGLIAAVILLIVVALVHLFTVTLKAPDADAQAQILDQSLLVKGPDAVSLLNISDAGLLVRIDGRLGIDPDTALDLWLGQRTEASWWSRKDRSIVEWALGKMGGVRVEVGQLQFAEPDWALDLEEKYLDLIPSDSKRHSSSDALSKSAELITFGLDGRSVRSKPNTHPPQDLMSFHIDPIIVPFPQLRSRLDESQSRDNKTHRAHQELRPLNLTLLLKPVSPAPYLMEVAKAAIKQRKATLDIKVASLNVRGLGKRELNRGDVKGGRWNVPGWINLGQGDIRKRISQRVPKLKDSNSTSDLLDLQRYEFFEIGSEAIKDAASVLASRALGIKAFAKAKNPLGDLLHGHVRYNLPFGAFLPLPKTESTGLSSAGQEDATLLAVIASDPLELTGAPNISLSLQGRVVPPADGIGESAETSGDAYTSVPGAGQAAFGVAEDGPARTAETPAQAALSNFLSRFLRGDPNTVLVRGGSPFAEGDPQNDPTLPGGGSRLPEWLDGALRLLDLPINFPGSKVTDLIKNVTINDLKITPHPFEKEKLDPEPPEPLPSPLPKHAFGRVRPHNYTEAKTYIDPTDPKKQRKLLRSELKDVPITVLDGRGKEFRAYTWKLVTGEGALTGIEGKAKAKIWNSGLGHLTLQNLPVKGAFMVGKRGGGDDDDDDDDLS
ncbi:hypothetical protein CBOM_03142 [Ceraceosorus bombacis]|uniref:Uncharacterized protein n=1 Tax=Ceraceosorus bombacis TaxID=401625 RepID=A0A0P1BLX6_9BASI|nr:hypothetical protein CBOM_03142 [Ceraceosorus bombacis]